MGGAASKNKGSDFERQVSKALSLWVSENADPFVFARRSGSGGAGRDKAGGTNHGGDIFADKPAGLFLTDATCFELKFYADLTSELWRLLACDKSQLREFIRQAKESADVYNRSWTLVFKCNRRETLVLSTFDGFKYLIKDVHTISTGSELAYLFPFERLIETPVEKFREYLLRKSGE